MLQNCLPLVFAAGTVFACAAVAQAPVPSTVAPVLEPGEAKLLQIISMKEAAPKQDLPATVSQQSGQYEITLANHSDAGVLLYAIAFQFRKENGEPAGTKSCFSSFTVQFDRPKIGPHRTLTFTQPLSGGSSGGAVVPTVDLVLFTDGTYEGQDACDSMKMYRTHLMERRATQRQILRYLQENGAEQTKQMLERELEAAKDGDRKYFNPERVQLSAGK